MGDAIVHAVLFDTDIVEKIFRALARETHGCTSAFWLASEACVLWHIAARKVDEQLANWCEHSWELTWAPDRFDDTVLPLRAACFSWELVFNLQKPARFEDEDFLCTEEVFIACAQLRVPNASALPAGWSRRAEWTLSLHHATDSSKSIHK